MLLTRKNTLTQGSKDIFIMVIADMKIGFISPVPHHEWTIVFRILTTSSLLCTLW